MPQHALKRDRRPAEKIPKHAARIEVLTCDPCRKVVIVPGCHIDSMPEDESTYFLQAGDSLIGMIVEGGTVEYDPADHTYVVRLADGMHSAD